MNPHQPSDSALQRRFNLKAFLAARHMKPQSYGTLDVSVEWPLVPSLTSNGNLLTFANTIVVIPRRTGYHTIVTRFAFYPRTVPVAGDGAGLSVSGQNGTFPLVDIKFFAAKLSSYPVVGCIVTDTAAAGGTYRGMNPIYMPEGSDLIMSYGGDPASTTSYIAEYFQLPSSQPMTSLFNYS